MTNSGWTPADTFARLIDYHASFGERVFISGARFCRCYDRRGGERRGSRRRGVVVNGLTQTIVAAKSYKTIKDLRGATIGVQVLTSGATNVLKRILKQNGLEYPADYKLLAVGGGNFNLAALTSGQIG